MEQYFKQNSWSGGLADSVIRGIRDSFAESIGLDIHSSPGLLKVNQALVKESASIVTDFCKYGLLASDGNAYFFGDTGKIYKRTSGGTWSNVYTDGNGAILGCEEHDGYIYWATATKLGRQSTALAASEATWSSQNNIWQTLDTASYHPMIKQGLWLFIGNDRKIASVDDAQTFTAQGTPDVTLAALPHDYEIKTLERFGIDIIVGTFVSVSFASARIFRWDTVSPAYNSNDDIPEIGINAFIPADNFMFVQAGDTGNVYHYNGDKLEFYKNITGDYVNKTMTVHPGSRCVFKGLPLFGVSNLSSNPCLEGVYSIGRHDKNYPFVLNLEYLNSHAKSASVEVGAMIAIGTNLIVCWKDSTTYGADNISYSAKHSGAYFKTLAIGGNRWLKKIFKRFNISYKSKPASTDITLNYDKNHDSGNTSLTLTADTSYNKLKALGNIEAGVMQFKCSFTISGNSSPEMEEFYTEWMNKDTL